MVTKSTQVILKTFTIVAVASGLVTTPLAHANLRQEQPLAEQAVQKVLGATEKVVKQSPFNFDAGVCFGIAVIGRGGKIQTPYSLQRGVRYLFIGGGDANAQNIDLVVLDAKGKTVAQDTAPDAVPVVFFTPKYTGQYRLALQLKKGRTTSSFCAMVVMRKTGGYKLPISSIREISQPSEAFPPDLNQVASQLRFHRVPNQWAAFGAVLKQGERSKVPGLRYETGRHFFIGGSDGIATNLGLTLLNSAGQTLVQTKQDGAAPWIIHQTDSRQAYQLMLSNSRSKGASLIFVVVLDIKAGGATSAATGSAQASSPVRSGIAVRLNGRPMQFRSGGAIEVNGRVMVPLRELFEAMGAEVDNDGNSFFISSEDDELELQIGSPVATINDSAVRLETAPILHNGFAMVPLRFFIQAAGAKVEWNQQQRTVSITVAQ